MSPASQMSANVQTSRLRALQLIMNGEYETALEVARQQVENGAQIIDVNMDEAMLESEEATETFQSWSHRNRASAVSSS